MRCWNTTCRSRTGVLSSSPHHDIARELRLWHSLSHQYSTWLGQLAMAHSIEGELQPFEDQYRLCSKRVGREGREISFRRGHLPWLKTGSDLRNDLSTLSNGPGIFYSFRGSLSRSRSMVNERMNVENNENADSCAELESFYTSFLWVKNDCSRRYCHILRQQRP